MKNYAIHLRAFAFGTCVALLAFSDWANADPPSRVARPGYTTGAVSVSPAGESDWVHASINRPLTSGDRLWADAHARLNPNWRRNGLHERGYRRIHSQSR